MLKSQLAFYCHLSVKYVFIIFVVFIKYCINCYPFVFTISIEKSERINGSWCEWYPISHCNVSCGYGYQEMIRCCACPGPKNGGSSCEGPTRGFHLCNPVNCSSAKANGILIHNGRFFYFQSISVKLY